MDKPIHDPTSSKRVADYLNEADPDAVITAHNEAYGPKNVLERKDYDQFRASLNGKIGVASSSNMRVVLTHVTTKWSEHPGCGEDDDYINVGGADDEEANWSLSFFSWGEWKLLPVEDRTGKSLTTAQIVAHLYFEITWHGSEEDAVDRLVHLEDVTNKWISELEAQEDSKK